MAVIRRLGPTVAVLVLGVGLALRPGPDAGWDSFIGAPDQEVAPHLWGLHAAARHGPGWPPGALRLAGTGAPDGVEIVLPDVLNVLVYAPAAALGGPVVGWTAVAAAGAALAGAAAALLASRLGAPAWLGAGLALAGGPLLGLLGDGQSEGWTFGVALAGFLLIGDRRRRARLAGGVLLGLGALGGPYNVVFAAVLALGALGLRAGRRAAGRAGLAPWALAAALAGPTLFTAVHERDDALPGSAARAGREGPAPEEGPWRGGRRSGIDLLDLITPGPLGPPGPPVSHSGEVPTLILGAAVLAGRRRRAARPYLAGAGLLLSLSLGPRLTVAGQDIGPGPAAAAMAAAPPLQRITRWYRAAPIAHTLLAAVAAAAPRSTPGRLLLLGAGALTGFGSRARPYPVPRAALPAGPWAALPGATGFVELPPSTAGAPAPGGWRDRTLLDQVLHGLPTAATGMGLPRGPDATRIAGDAETVLRGGALPAHRAAAWSAAGLSHLVVRTHARPLPAAAAQHLARCFGPPVAEADGVQVHAVPTAGCGRPARRPGGPPQDSGVSPSD